MRITAGAGRCNGRRTLRVTVRDEHRELMDQLWGRKPLLKYVVQAESDEDRRLDRRRLLIIPDFDGQRLHRSRTPDGTIYHAAHWFINQGLPWLPRITRGTQMSVLSWNHLGLELALKKRHPDERRPQPAKKVEAAVQNGGCYTPSLKSIFAELNTAKGLLNTALRSAEKGGLSITVEQQMIGGPVALVVKF